jgi:hypothetical protein
MYCNWGGAGVAQSVVSDYGLGYHAMEVRPPAEAKDFPLTSVSRPALGPTQPPVQQVLGVVSPGVKRGLGVTLTIHPHLEPRSSPPCASTSVLWGCFTFTTEENHKGRRNASFRETWWIIWRGVTQVGPWRTAELDDIADGWGGSLMDNTLQYNGSPSRHMNNRCQA